MTEAALVRVEGLSKTFTNRQSLLGYVLRQKRRSSEAVKNVSFSIAKGKTFALVGESGSGKSTIARMVVGLLPPSGGNVLIDGIAMHGEDVAHARQGLTHRIQMVFQDPYASLNPRWRVDAIVSEPILALRRETNRQAIAQRVAELLTLVGLHPADAQKYPHEFSGGQRQRIAIARALASDADFIVCDEPTSALDVSVQAQILNLMRDLQDRLGLTYLFISHNLAVVRYVADEIGVLYKGELVERGDGAAIFDHPQHAYTRQLIAAVPNVDALRREAATLAEDRPTRARAELP